MGNLGVLSKGILITAAKSNNNNTLSGLLFKKMAIKADGQFSYTPA
jgi:hypothetical protein